MKIFRSTLVVLLVLSVFFVSSISSYAFTTSGDYLYEEMDNGEAILLQYNGNESIVKIPSTIDGYKVGMLRRGIIVPREGKAENIEKIIIPAGIKLMDNYEKDKAILFIPSLKLKVIEFEGKDESYFTSNGVLFSKDKSILWCCPPMYENDLYSVPGEVTELGEMAFYNNSTIKSLKFEGQLSNIGSQALTNMLALEEAEYPKVEKSYKKFTDCPNLKKVVISKEISEMNDSDFQNSPNVVLHVYDNSYGLEWAKSHNFEYVIIEEKTSSITGDVNYDNEININDVTTIQKYLVELVKFSEEQISLADYNLDGKVNIRDATSIQRFLIKI